MKYYLESELNWNSFVYFGVCNNRKLFILFSLKKRGLQGKN
jgi:hypothetical protein